jgi:AcrR family transcriptional regulator
MADNTPTHSDPERGQQRRCQVLDAAASCFRRYGFHGCSMAQLARESGMSVGHIYHYFQNKEAIIDAIVKRDLYECLDSIEQLRTSQQILLDMVGNLNDPVTSSLNRDNAALQCEILAEAARNPKVAEMVHAAHLHVRHKVAELIQMGSKRSLSEQELDTKIEVIGALFDGLMVRTIRNPNIHKDQLLPILRSTMLHILEY